MCLLVIAFPKDVCDASVHCWCSRAYKTYFLNGPKTRTLGCYISDWRTALQFQLIPRLMDSGAAAAHVSVHQAQVRVLASLSFRAGTDGRPFCMLNSYSELAGSRRYSRLHSNLEWGISLYRKQRRSFVNIHRRQIEIGTKDIYRTKIT